MAKAKQPEQSVPVFNESIGGSVIDAARISVIAAMHLIPSDPDAPPQIILPGDTEEDLPPPTVHECLHQAMQWLDAARALSVQQGPPVTSMHVIAGKSGT